MSIDIRHASRAIVVASLSLMMALLVPPAHALTVIPMEDERLFDQADVVLIGTVVSAAAAPGRALDDTEYQIAVERALKGQGPANGIVRLTVPGALDPSEEGARIVMGAPRFAPPERVLVLLNEHAPGRFRATQLMLGVFRYRTLDDGSEVLDQDGSDGESVDPETKQRGRSEFARARNAERFERWAEERGAGRPGDRDYWRDTPRRRPNEAKFKLSTPASRWFDFDQGATVPLVVSFGEGGGSTARIEAVTTAIDAWNNAPGTRIALQYAGEREAGTGLAGGDGMNQVLFNDPNNEITGIFDCLLGGVGAFTQWRSRGTRSFQGQSFLAISEGDIVVQEGIDCLFSGPRSLNAEELMTHELGHLLGLDHACGGGLLDLCIVGTDANDAIMRSTLHGNRRGSRLGDDDLAGVRALYRSLGGGGGVVSPSPTPGIPGTSTGSGGGGGGSGTFGGSALIVLGALALMRRRPQLKVDRG